jgi:hypothetical protein
MIMVLLKQPQRTEHAMPETIPQIRPSFNRSLRLETRPELLSADTGALVQRELMERSGLIDWLTERLHDPRHPSSIRYPLSDLLRTRLLLLGQGWRDQSDADRLRQDPSLRVASQTRRGTAALEEGHGLASQPTLSRLLDTLSREENLPVLHQAVTELACRRIEMIEGRRRKRGKKTPRKKRRKKTMYLDVDGLPVEVHGHPPGSEWNGYYRQRMYHGLVASCAETGDLIDGEIFPGASYLGKKALKLTLRVVDRCRGRLCGSMIVRMDAGFPEPGLLKGLESRSVPYIARIRKNEVLNRMAKPYLTQPAGRSPDAPPRLWFHELTYQAESWDRARRVVLVVRERPGELYPDHFWLLTSLSRKRYEAEALLAKYRKREGGRPHGGVDGRARSGLVLREPAQDALSGEAAEIGSQAGSEDGGRGSPPQRSPVPAESAGVRDPAPGSGADGAGDASGLESASFSRAAVASGVSGAAPGEAIDFRHQSRGDGLEAVVAETGAGVLGAGIVDGGGIGPVEGTETVGISHRKVNLSAGDGPPGR